jgi:hypothetical protein
MDTGEGDARALIAGALSRGVRATPLCRAVMGWLCGAPTEPSVAEIRRSADGWVWLRLSGESAATPLLSYLEFLDQVRVICRALRMSDDQTRQITGWAQMRLF